MFAYFMDAEVTISAKLVQIMYILSGVFCIYCGIRAWMKKDNKYYLPTGLFWSLLGVVVAFGQWLPPIVSGIIVAPKEEQLRNFKRIGMKIFIPAFGAGVFTILISIFLPGWSSLIGSLFATIFGVIILVLWNKENRPMVFLEEGRRFLDMTSAVYIMPLLLSCLGAVFTRAGVGDAFSVLFGKIIPSGNVYIGIVAYALGMMLFTIIMGNAFAAITVMTVGVAYPLSSAWAATPCTWSRWP